MHESEVIFKESIPNNNMCLVKEYFFFPSNILNLQEYTTHTQLEINGKEKLIKRKIRKLRKHDHKTRQN